MSHASSPLRLDWRPSRLAQVTLALIAALALIALAHSDLPWPFAVTLGALVASASGWELHRMRRQPAWSLIVSDTAAADAEWLVDGHARSVRLRAVHLRGPIIGIRFDPDGQLPVHALWWPDTLDAQTRRALMLLAREPLAQRPPPSTPDPN